VKGYHFIFSNRPLYRLLRHLAFWAVFILHYSLQNMLIGGLHEALRYRSIPAILQYDAFFVPAFMISAYFFMYVVIPHFLFQKKITAFVLVFSGLIALNLICANYVGILYIHISSGTPFDKIHIDTNKYNVIVNGFWIPLIVMGLSGGIRLTKKWVLQQKANELLVKQKISHEVKLLKTQIHPRFLFHSLNSLEDKLKKKQADSPGLILKLADILSYILYESESDYVLVGKEIEVIGEYVELQKTNFPDSLRANLEINIPSFNLYIAPLILLPFVETSFECLTMNDDSDKNINIVINANEETLFFSLTCFEECSSENNSSQQQIWADITRRIESLYPNNHQLLLKSDSHGIQIELRINMNGSENKQQMVSWSPNPAYEFS
jgi:two-component system LytT family sensor kinase